jgi:hypothetical protein
MGRLVLMVMVAASLAGCAAHGPRTHEGYAMYGDERDAGQQRRADDVRRSQSWSTHDFVYPRGLIW